MKDKVYHEKQVRQMCALHVLNNLFQDGSAFTKADLDGICNDLDPTSWLNPHKSALGLGNYDVNVVMMALQKKGLKAVWFDKRRKVSDLNFSHVFGLILNVPGDFKLFGISANPFNSKHWIAIKALPDAEGSFYNLDSQLDEPEPIGKEQELVAHLTAELSQDNRELLIVVEENVKSVFQEK